MRSPAPRGKCGRRVHINESKGGAQKKTSNVDRTRTHREHKTVQVLVLGEDEQAQDTGHGETDEEYTPVYPPTQSQQGFLTRGVPLTQVRPIQMAEYKLIIFTRQPVPQSLKKASVWCLRTLRVMKDELSYTRVWEKPPDTATISTTTVSKHNTSISDKTATAIKSHIREKEERQRAADRTADAIRLCVKDREQAKLEAALLKQCREKADINREQAAAWGRQLDAENRERQRKLQLPLVQLRAQQQASRSRQGSPRRSSPNGQRQRNLNDTTSLNDSPYDTWMTATSRPSEQSEMKPMQVQQMTQSSTTLQKPQMFPSRQSETTSRQVTTMRPIATVMRNESGLAVMPTLSTQKDEFDSTEDEGERERGHRTERKRKQVPRRLEFSDTDAMREALKARAINDLERLRVNAANLAIKIEETGIESQKIRHQMMEQMATLAGRLRHDEDRVLVTHELSCCVERLQMAEADRDFFRAALMRTTLYYKEVWDIAEDIPNKELSVTSLETKLTSAEHRVTEQAAVASMATNAIAEADDPTRLVAQVLMLRTARTGNDENDGDEEPELDESAEPELEEPDAEPEQAELDEEAQAAENEAFRQASRGRRPRAPGAREEVEDRDATRGDIATSV